MQAIRDHIRKEEGSPEGLHEGNAPSRKRRPHFTHYSSIPKDQAVELMQHGLLYLRQKMEFVKNYEYGQFAKTGDVVMGKTGVKFEVIRKVISQHENELSVSLLCEIAAISRSGYYSWLKVEEAKQARKKKDRADFALVLEAYCFRGYQKEARSIYMRLLQSDPPVRMNVKKYGTLWTNIGCSVQLGKQTLTAGWRRHFRRTMLPETC